MFANGFFAPPEIQTLAFLDLETTGFYTDAKPCRITEFGMVAIHRDEFLRSVLELQKNQPIDQDRNGDGETSQERSAQSQRRVNPRVLCKLVQAINPEMAIVPAAATVSRLSSDQLRVMPTFSNFAPAFWAYVNCLPKPVCFIAHNGIKFDFRVLLHELRRADSPGNVDGIFCADSINLFQNIDNEWIQESQFMLQATQATQVQQEIETISATAPAPELATESASEGAAVPTETMSQPIIRYRFNAIGDSPGSDYETSPPPRPSIDSGQSLSQNNGDHVRRQLFYCSQVTASALAKSKVLIVSQTQQNPKYSLKSAYQRIFGEDPPEHHSAEADCLSVMQIAAQYGEEFLLQVDKTAKPFQEKQEET